MMKKLFAHLQHGGVALSGNLASLFLSLGRVKLIAIVLGPSSMGLVSIYANLFELGATLFAAGYGGALNREIPRRSHATGVATAWRTALKATIVPALLLSPVVIWILYISTDSLHFRMETAVVLLLALLCSSLWRVTAGYMMGRRMSGALFRAVSLGALLSLIGAAILALAGVRDPLAYAVITPVLMLVAGLLSVDLRLFRPRSVLRRSPYSEVLDLSRTALPITITLLVLPVLWFYLRSTVETRLGPLALGYLQPSFQLVIVIAGLFGTFAGMTVVRWDQAQEPAYSARQLALLATAAAIPVLGSITIYFARPVLDWFIIALFSKEFLPASAALPWFLIGESLRMGAFLLNQTLISKGYNFWTLWPRFLSLAVIVALVENGFDSTLAQIGMAYAWGHLAYFALSLIEWGVVQRLPSARRSAAGDSFMG
jgi:PST family polysaccharide transporter